MGLAEIVSLRQPGDLIFMMIVMGVTLLNNRQSWGENVNYGFVDFLVGRVAEDGTYYGYGVAITN